jgi:ribonuclease P protein subunit POP4
MSPITPQNILRHELIGLNVTVSRCKNPSLRGARGTIVDESKNMLVLLREGKKLRIPKSIATFRLKLQDGTVIDVDGLRLVARPENRLKIRVRRW